MEDLCRTERLSTEVAALRQLTQGAEASPLCSQELCAQNDVVSKEYAECVQLVVGRVGHLFSAVPQGRHNAASLNEIQSQLHGVPRYRVLDDGAVHEGSKVEPSDGFDDTADLVLSLLRALDAYAARADQARPAAATSGTASQPQRRAPLPYDGGEPPLDFGQAGFLGQTCWSPRDWVHVAVLGETGAGKTVSAVQPLLRAALAYRCDGLNSAALVIDPKGDLTPVALNELRHRGRAADAVVLGEAGGQRLRFFGPQQAGLSVRDRYFKLAELVEVTQPTGGDGDRWMQKAHELCIAMLEIEQAWQSHARCALLPQLCEWLGWRRPATILAALDTLCLRVVCLAQLRLLATMLEVAIARASPTNRLPNPALRLAAMSSHDAFNQWVYESRNAHLVLASMAQSQVEAVLDLNIVGEAPDSVPCTRLLDEGRILLCQPESSQTGDFCARAIKAAFFQACLYRSELRRPIFYVVDEFQRFVTVEGDSAEMGFLDICRAYRVMVVLATQNYAGLLRRYGRASDLECLLLNLPTILVFRTRDDMARTHLYQALRPVDPHLPHVLDVRPIPQLATGECYYVSPRGAGRAQMQSVLCGGARCDSK